MGTHGKDRPRGVRRAAVACLALIGLVSLSTSAGAAPGEWRVSGGGTLSNGDHFGATATGLSGHWTHQAGETGQRLLGTVHETGCAVAGADNSCTVNGTGTFDGEEVRFMLSLSDLGEAGADDVYGIAIIRQSDNAVLYAFGGTIDNGNLQLKSRMGCEQGVC